RQWSDNAARTLAENPRLLATGGDGFPIIYARLAAEHLSLTDERRVVKQFLDTSQDGLFVFSDNSLTRWHFINVKYDTARTKRPLFRRITVGPEERLRTAGDRIVMLDLATLPDTSRMSIVQRHEEAFDVEKVTENFYIQYRMVFKILEKDLLHQRRDERWAHDYALQFLNRCMFLYFIQRKGWLGGDTHFLETFWSAYNKRREEGKQEEDTFFREWLLVLFFEAFNNSFNRERRYFPQAIYDILDAAPYLNGGLFSRNEDDRDDFTISDMRFRQVFDFLEHYNFTIAEDSPLDQEVAVDPEMIGHIYENLVNVSNEFDERGDVGIFYTPRTEIDLMCRLALADYLANELGEARKPLLYDVMFALEPEEQSEADDRLAALHLWDRLYNYLEHVAVIDPACGSGAFLVGMLYVLDDLQARACRYIANSPVGETPYQRRRRIIGANLYGVDVMSWAVFTAELRLWLTLIVEADIPRRELHSRRDPLLPYLTFKVRVGNSLVQEIGGVNFGHRQVTGDLSRSMKLRLEKHKAEKMNFYYHEETGGYKTKEAAIQAEIALFRDIIQERRDAAVQDIANLHEKPIQRGLLDKQLEIGTSEREQRIVEKQRNLDELEQVLRELGAGRVPFVWDIAFVEIFSGTNQGFDIVIGNPPYVRQEEISDPGLARKDVTPANKQAYKKKLALTVYQEFSDFFQRGNKLRPLDAKSDLYIYFYLHGLSLLNEKGAFCFITSNSWLDVGYGKDLQEFLLKRCRIHMIIDNQVKRSFATADVNTIIALFSAPLREWSDAAVQHTARFVTLSVGYEQILDAEVFRDIDRAAERAETEAYRVYPIAQSTLLAEGYQAGAAGTGEDATESRETRAAPARRRVKEAAAVYATNKWGGKYLRAPEIYWTILEKGRGKLARLGDIADVRFGIKTGANEFFYLDEQKAMQWGIEEEFLRPVIKSPRECKSILIDPAALKFRLFMCHKSKAELHGTHALTYIEWGETQSFSNNPSVANRARWWDVGEQEPFDLVFLRFRDKRNWNPTNATPSLLAGDIMFIGTWHDRSVVKINNALANSTLSVLISEIYGRVNLGDGLLTTYGPEILNFDFVSAAAFSDTEKQKLLAAFDAVAKRDVKSIFDEVDLADRRTLDDVIFDVLGLKQNERDDVYKAVIELVESRLQKASSLRQEKERGRRIKAVEQTLGIWIGIPDDFLEEVHDSYA
ncbi:MAG: Eco57I restriction-modification methylase domain-containing protein, partial [Ktedonobacteraceae bacterium]